MWKAVGSKDQSGKLTAMPVYINGDGYDIDKGDRFKLVAIYENPTSHNVDAMAGVFILYSSAPQSPLRSALIGLVHGYGRGRGAGGAPSSASHGGRSKACRLEYEPQAKLDQPRILSAGDHVRRARSVRREDRGAGRIEVGVIERIEDVRPEVKPPVRFF